LTLDVNCGSLRGDMTAADLVDERLRNQRLTRPAARQPEELVSWLGAVQAQDFAGAKWALALRATGLTDAAVDRAFDDGRILRTHVLRPTWHFVAPADIRWMLALTAARVHSLSGFQYRQHDLDDKVFARAHAVMTRALEGGRHLTRAELQVALRKSRIESNNLRLGLLMMQAELSALICSGPRRGKQFTYALLDERVPPAPTLSREEALAALTMRYIASHGPVTVRDLSWWSGLNMREAKTGIDMVAPASATGSGLERRELDGCTYWSIASTGGAAAARARRRRADSAGRAPVAVLSPNYDEYYIAYKDRHSLLQGSPWAATAPPPRGLRPEFAHLLTLDGWLAGSWKRTMATRRAAIVVRPFRRLKKPERAAVDEAVARYGTFLNMPVALSFDQA
jgi:hypothetical protein